MNAAAEKKVSQWRDKGLVQNSQYGRFLVVNATKNVLNVELDVPIVKVFLSDGTVITIEPTPSTTDLDVVEVTAKKEYWTILGITMKIQYWIMTFSGLGILLIVAAILLIKKLKS